MVEPTNTDAELEELRPIVLGVRDWGRSLASQEFDDDPLEGVKPAVALKAILAYTAREVAKARKFDEES